jgi:uncharacterized alkaline shock family protein YloU
MAEIENPYTDADTHPGKTTIAPEVLLAITRLTTLSVDGVSRMSPVMGGVNRLFQRGVGEGMRIEIKGDLVFADLYVVLKNEVNFRDVSREIQRQVSRAISEMVGMNVGRVNVHVEDVDYPEEPEA